MAPHVQHGMSDVVSPVLDMVDDAERFDKVLTVMVLDSCLCRGVRDLSFPPKR